MKKLWQTSFRLGLALGILLSACGDAPTSTLEPDGDSAITIGEATEVGEGTLAVRANGEERVRNGFTTKDGWALDFTHLYVSLANVNAYQANPSFDPAIHGGMPEAKVTIAILRRAVTG